MDSIANLLQDRSANEPPQLNALREYVKAQHNVEVSVSVSQMGYVVEVPNAPLATILRMEQPKITVACKLDKKLFIRIRG